MSMSKQDCIALADAIRWANSGVKVPVFSHYAIGCIADVCQVQNSAFDRDRWLAYIAGECGPNGGTIKPTKTRSLNRKDPTRHPIWTSK